MDHPETPLRRMPAPALRLAASAPTGEGKACARVAPGPLDAILEMLADLGPDRALVADLLLQRLGDARTLALLAQGESAARTAKLMAEAASNAGDAVRASLAEPAGDAAGRLASVRSAIRFGQVLLAQGLVASRRLEAALEAQKSSGRRLGEELAAAGHTTPREVAEALWLQHKLAAVVLALLLLPARETSATRLLRSAP